MKRCNFSGMKLLVGDHEVNNKKMVCLNCNQEVDIEIINGNCIKIKDHKRGK